MLETASFIFVMLLNLETSTFKKWCWKLDNDLVIKLTCIKTSRQKYSGNTADLHHYLPPKKQIWNKTTTANMASCIQAAYKLQTTHQSQTFYSGEVFAMYK